MDRGVQGRGASNALHLDVVFSAEVWRQVLGSCLTASLKRNSQDADYHIADHCRMAVKQLISSHQKTSKMEPYLRDTKDMHETTLLVWETLTLCLTSFSSCWSSAFCLASISAAAGPGEELTIIERSEAGAFRGLTWDMAWCVSVTEVHFPSSKQADYQGFT